MPGLTRYQVFVGPGTGFERPGLTLEDDFPDGLGNIMLAVEAAELTAPVVLLAMIAILLALGCFIDQVSMMLLTLPFFMPLVQHYGYDPVWFGVLYLIAMQLGLLTPPFGMLLFTMKGVAPKQITMAQIFRAVTPYVLIGLVMLAVVMLIPGLAVWLPGRLLGK